MEELPNTPCRKQWEKGLKRALDCRIKCLFVDRDHWRNGIAEVAVRGALAIIAAEGGGLVESYPHDLPPEEKTSAFFLYNATRTMYERHGFEHQRPKGQGNRVMTKEVAPAVTHVAAGQSGEWARSAAPAKTAATSLTPRRATTSAAATRT